MMNACHSILGPFRIQIKHCVRNLSLAAYSTPRLKSKPNHVMICNVEERAQSGFIILCIVSNLLGTIRAVDEPSGIHIIDAVRVESALI